MFTSCSQNKIKIPKEFKLANPPKVWSDDWYKLNNSKNEFKVEITNSKLHIGKAEKNNECQLKIETGTFLGIDHGEFGGQLTFIPNDKTKSNIKITRGNIKFIFQFKDKIYFITGLAHMSHSAGAMFELNTEENNFTYKKVIDFDDAPEAFAIYNEKILIASDKSFYIVKDLKKTILFKNVFWEGLYPNSIATFNNENVFIGIRSGIVKLDLTHKILKFYKKN